MQGTLYIVSNARYLPHRKVTTWDRVMKLHVKDAQILKSLMYVQPSVSRTPWRDASGLFVGE